MIKGIERSTLYICIFLTLAFTSTVAAQTLTPELPVNKWLTLAEEQYQQQHYILAAQSASKFLLLTEKSTYPLHKNEIDKAKFYLSLSVLKTSKPGCTDTAIAFINNTSNPAYKQRAAYFLAQYYFNRNEFEAAIPYYEMAGIANLDNSEIANAKFELAYCYFNNKQFEEAEELFASIKEIEGNYHDAGNYYYGLLAYNRANYPDALQSFERIADNKEYRDIVPYYIAEIYYFTGNKQKALDYSLKLIKRKEKLYYDNELHLLAAQVLFEQQKFEDALPYFEHYYQNINKIRKEDLYEMAYCYFMVKNWNEAIEKFKPLSSTRDSLGQTAMYLLGDCYLKTNDKKSARNAFSICSDMPFNKGQQEASLLLTAKLSYEMGYNDDAVNRVKDLIASFPSSRYADEAKTMLSDLLIRSNNYKEAYSYIHNVTKRDAAFWPVHQKVTYGYAMQQLQNGNDIAADSLLSLSLKNPADRSYEAAANFWKGDVAYRLRRYNESVIYTRRFLEQTDERDVIKISPDATVENANMNLGYASMAINDYKAAQDYFNRARKPYDEGSDRAMNTILREADAVFMQKDYENASKLYDKVIAANGTDADYARFQKAILLGLQGKNTEKTTLLQSLINTTPPSAYAVDARYEMALAYIEEDKYQHAINSLQPLTEAYEHRNIVPKAWMKIGFCYQQLNEVEQAISAYKKVVVEYPVSEEKPAALDALKSLYLLNNKPAAYAQLLKENNLSADDHAIDSAYYVAAETQFAASNWKEAKKGFEEYLEKYPNGALTLKAHYYKAESNFQLKEYEEALKDHDWVLSNPWNDFSENSARHAANLAFSNKNYDAALDYYGRLRNNSMNQENLVLAYSGLMRSSFELNQNEMSAAYADTLLSLGNIETGLMNDALLYKARSLSKLDKTEEAVAIYKQLESSKKPAVISEVQYHIARSQFSAGQFKEAEATANKAIQAGGSDVWVVKAYILLADILTKQKDYFNAKATLQSIVKNTRIEELKEEASRKLEEVKTLEQKQSKLSDQ